MRSASSRGTVLVAGAGIFGISAALELHERGWRVTIVDPGPLPHPLAASTDISKVVRADYGADEGLTDLAIRAIEHWEEWNLRDRHAGRPELYHPDGFLLLSRDGLRPGGFEGDSHDLLRRRGFALERVAPQDTALRFPAWNPGLYADGYLNPRAGWVESGRVVARLAEQARARGIVVHEGVRAAGLIEESPDPDCAGGSSLPPSTRVRGLRTAGGEEMRADWTLLTTGAWTVALLPELAPVLRISAQPVLHFAPADPRVFRGPRFPVWAADIARTGWYGFPANADGVVKVARHGPGCRVDPDAPRTVAQDEEPRFRAFLAESLPDLAGAPLAASRTCLYVDSFDGDFWIAPHPSRPGLAVATGDSGHGFKFAPVLGGLIADALEGRENPFSARFGWRAPGPRTAEHARFTG